ncbi:stage II sporulation protein M [Halogeometricum sp. S1BR25-6]|uniref:Stage II sporulation protein M n=1 Tax=Halogeometricum salsisoli TaxID=2950536 RepID=A0ABU2G8Z6_9EURY|nr:stage II sporulation protein M [Halogeometricum sp. S1BR25-6]MDS0297266.1 stage II sporulation protein M [Halogeometricum sp. S1BR25-6]
MNVSTALRAGVRMLSEYSASVLPVYLLATGLVGVARVPMVLTLLAAFALVSLDGRLGRVLDIAGEIDVGAMEGGGIEGGTVGPDAIPPELGDAVVNLFSSEVLALFGLGLLGSLLLSFVVSPIASAASVHGVFGPLRSDDAVRSALLGARDDWLSFLGVQLLLLAALAASVVPFALFGLLGVTLFHGAGVAGILGILAGALLSGLLALAVLLLFAFAEQAVVVDGLGAVAAVRRSAGFPFRRPTDFVGYVAVALGALILTGGVALVASVGGAARVSSLLGAVLVPPVLDGFKTALYAERDLPRRETPPMGDRFRAAYGGGLRALGGFVREHPLANAVSAVCFAGGLAGGWAATSPYVVEVPIEGEIAAVFGSFPLATFVNLAVNNWLVAADAAYGGVAFGVSSVTSLVFNGLIVGALGGVFDSGLFAALVVPHGIIEVPALVFGGGVGVWLGGVGLRVARGRTGADGLAAAVRRAYRVLLGLVPLFVVAAFVEAFLTPRIASLLVG